MRRGQLLAIVLVALLVSSGLALAKARGSPDLSVHLPSNDVTPGADSSLELYLQNAGTVAYATSPAEQSRVTTARDVEVTLEAEDVPIEVESGTQPIGSLPEGRSNAIPFEISVAEDAEPGEYELEATVEYKYTNVIGSEGAYNDKRATIRRDVTVVVEDDARFRIVDASAEDLFGSAGPVSVTIENTGTAAATDARVAIESGTNQLTFGGTQAAETFVGRWPAGETRTLTLEGTLAPGADRRAYPLAATVNYEDPDGQQSSSDPLQTGVTPLLENRFGLSDVESSLTVGEEGTVSGTITNRGDSAVRNAVVVLSPSSQTVEVVESEYSVGDLEPGASTSFEFDVEISEASAGGPRQFSFVVQYRDRSLEQRESDPLDARVDVGAQRDIFSVSPVDASVEAGGNGLLELRVTNEGDAPVSDVSAKLFANAPISATDDEAFIDELEPGETQRITFGIGAGAGALEKVYPISVDFQYDESDGDTLLSDTYQIPIQVSEPTSDGGGPPILPIALVIVLVAGAGYYLYRRRAS